MEILKHEGLQDKVTLKAGGRARFFATARSISDITEASSFAKKEKTPLIPMGGGSNILPSDGVLDVCILHIGMLGITEEEEVVVGAGEDWDRFVEKTVSDGYYDLVNLSAIPGAVGAAPIQNIGAYGSEVSESIVWVEAYDVKEEKVRTFSNKECGFLYRDSLFKQVKDRFVVTRVAFLLTNKSTPNLHYADLAHYFKGYQHTPNPKEVRSAVINIRSKKFPDLTKTGTAGSFFLNPILSEHELEGIRTLFPDIPTYKVSDGSVKIPLAYILEHLGLRGACIGNVCAFQNQPLVLINNGTKKADDILTFAKHIEETVFKKTNLKIKKEVRILT